MSSVTKQQVLRLYKHLIRYGNQLKLTDKDYFIKRIRKEFRQNRDNTTEDEIKFSFKRRNVIKKRTDTMMALMNKILKFPSCSCNTHLIQQSIFQYIRWKTTTVDYSKVPKLKEEDLEEHFTRGSGPGGQAVAKTANCVLLRHIPTNTVVKCHIHRTVTDNQKEARKILINKLDVFMNGDLSVESQRKSMLMKKNVEKYRRHKKMSELKSKWKETEGKEEN